MDAAIIHNTLLACRDSHRRSPDGFSHFQNMSRFFFNNITSIVTQDLYFQLRTVPLFIFFSLFQRFVTPMSKPKFNKRLQSFAPYYSQSLLLADFKENHIPQWFNNPYKKIRQTRLL
jgi:hypothetical protein